VEENVHVFHAGTTLDATGQLVTAGGRVFAVTAVAPTLEAARAESARVAGAIELEGKQLRRDIGWREQERGAGAPGN
jgi:phosphoribosylamine-glycine ligase